MNDILGGELVRLGPIDPEEFSKAFAIWSRDSGFNRLLQMNATNLQSSNAIKRWVERDLEDSPVAFYPFSIRTLADDKLVGGTDIEIVNWNGRNAFVGIFIGGREDWGKGYGTDAMKVLLRYAFMELNLWRVSLGVFEYNPRAVRSYEKAGFHHEGSMRQALNREGRRWDMLFMGILREEWMKLNQ